MMTMSLEDPHQVEQAMDKQLEKHHGEALAPAGALQTMADGLPALGIVAAVLGVIKTMGAISEPPEVLGRMIGSALVGTFLGVFLAYGIVGPMATRLKAIVDEDALFYHVIRDILVAHLHGNAAQVSVEIGRGSIPSVSQPSFKEVEDALNEIPPEPRDLAGFIGARFRGLQVGERHEETGQRTRHHAERHGIDHVHVAAQDHDRGHQKPRPLSDTVRHGSPRKRSPKANVTRGVPKRSGCLRKG